VNILVELAEAVLKAIQIMVLFGMIGAIAFIIGRLIFKNWFS